MARLKQSTIGRPSAARVAGEGEERTIQMGDAGQVFKCASSVPRDGISRDPGQDLPHMQSNVDPVTRPLNKGGSGRPDEWDEHPLDVAVVMPYKRRKK